MATVSPAMPGPAIIQVVPSVYAVDLKPTGIPHFISSYVLVGHEVAIIDYGPPCSVPNLIEALGALGIRPEAVRYVLATHIHIDHAGGAAELLDWAREAELLVHPRGVKHMADPSRLWESTKAVLGRLAELYGRIRPVDKDRISAIRDGDEVSIAGGPTLQVLETPGHASHHLSFFEPEKRMLFPGDSAGVYISPLDLLVPTTPFPFRLDLALASLDRQAALEPELVCYTHFGCSNQAVRRLRDYRAQLELWADIIRANLGQPEERILELLAARDPQVARALELAERMPVLRGVLSHSITGMVRSFERFGCGGGS